MYNYKSMLTVCIVIHLWSVFLITSSEKVKGKKVIVEPNVNVTPDWNEYRYDKASMILTKLETTSICKPNMRFFADPNNETLGECDCDYFDCTRPFIYSPKTKQCHLAWTQGPCAKGQWYAFNSTLKPVCEQNACLQAKSNNTKTPFYYLYPGDNKCYEVGSRAYCKGEDEFLGTSLDEPIPSCRSYLLCGGVSFPATQQCIPGHKLSFAGPC